MRQQDLYIAPFEAHAAPPIVNPGPSIRGTPETTPYARHVKSKQIMMMVLITSWTRRHSLYDGRRQLHRAVDLARVKLG
jgi:hypothetical protein